jgi:NAD(P)-dependent dehydrogenase (short-subunit alcohol dehydrogenase family)
MPSLSHPSVRGEPSVIAARDRKQQKRVFITGSSDGLGYRTAQTLLAQGHRVIVHVRAQARLPAVATLVEQGAIATVGDLSDITQIRDLARQVNELGRMDAVIHNAGTMGGQHAIVVNTVAPYLLTALIHRPQRLIYVSSNMHQGGSTELAGIDWTGQRATRSYSDSKLFVTALAAAVARLWPAVYSNSVNPGWVPTKMGGPGAPDDLRLGHATQEWLAISGDAEARTSGGYWFHKRRDEPHPAVHDVRFQDQLLAALARATGVKLV